MRISPESIFWYVRRAYSVSQKELESDDKFDNLAEARRLATLLLIENANRSFKEIGKCLKKHHTTILDAYRQAKIQLSKDEEFRSLIKEIRDRCGQEAAHRFEKQEKRRVELRRIRFQPHKTPYVNASSMTAVMKAVCEEFQIDRKSLLSKCNKQSVVLPRKIVFFLLRNMAGQTNSLPVIGRMMERNHMTVLRGCESIELAVASNAKLASKIERIRARLAPPQHPQ